MEYRYIIENESDTLSNNVSEHLLHSKEALDELKTITIAIRIQVDSLNLKDIHKRCTYSITDDTTQLSELDPVIIVKVNNKWEEFRELLPKDVDVSIFTYAESKLSTHGYKIEHTATYIK